MLPATVGGVRAAGDPGRIDPYRGRLRRRGRRFLADATAAGVDAYLTADLRHHPASEHLAGGGPALLDAAHWATERPWLDDVAACLRRRGRRARRVVSDVDTDPWTVHAAAPATKEPSREG